MASLQDNPKTQRIAGSPALDFLNTAYAPMGNPIEILDTPHAFLVWLLNSQLISNRDFKSLKASFKIKDEERLLSKALILRERLRKILTNFQEKGGSGLLQSDLQYLNQILSLAPSRLQVLIDEQHKLKFNQVYEWNHPEQVLALIAESFLRTLQEEPAELIKMCSAPRCTVWFIDRTKAHKKQYCTQEGCGNRAKVRAFRARAQESS